MSFPQVPGSITEFETLQTQLGTSPEGAVALMVLAIHLYGKDSQLGNQAIITAILKKNRQKSSKPTAYKGEDLGNGDRYLIGQLDKYKMLATGYFKGAEPGNGYTASTPLTVETFTNPYSGDEASGKIKLFVATKGASSYRPVTVEKESDGIWRAKEFSSLCVGMMPPK
ncbi:signal peptide [Leptospira ryugenii]|uniref:Signal peptide n=1 Tax=Leptospira ryugenii TaxID=1917863 RepID=A0A2P2E518_9LEPT|nr:signal peptide [Leptospira ryugenii]